jgi:hypothetical protein
LVLSGLTRGLGVLSSTPPLDVVFFSFVGLSTTDVLKVLTIRPDLFSLVGSRPAGVLEVEFLGLAMVTM